MIDKMSIDKMIEVLKAAQEGKAIQHRDAFNDWRYCNPAIPSGFLFYGDNEYRVAPEQRKPREWLLGVDIDGKLVDSSLYGGGRTIRVREVLE